jgi:hypothetical protein
MLPSEPLSIIFFLLLMIAGLVLAAWAARLQAIQYQTLSQLTVLERRGEIIEEAGRALQRMDTDADTLAILYGALAEDLRLMQQLDPTRSDLDKAIQQAEASARQKTGYFRRQRCGGDRKGADDGAASDTESRQCS